MTMSNGQMAMATDISNLSRNEMMQLLQQQQTKNNQAHMMDFYTSPYTSPLVQYPTNSFGRIELLEDFGGYGGVDVGRAGAGVSRAGGVAGAGARVAGVGGAGAGARVAGVGGAGVGGARVAGVGGAGVGGARVAGVGGARVAGVGAASGAGVGGAGVSGAGVGGAGVSGARVAGVGEAGVGGARVAGGAGAGARVSEACKFGQKCKNGLNCTFSHTNEHKEYFVLLEDFEELAGEYKILQRMYEAKLRSDPESSNTLRQRPASGIQRPASVHQRSSSVGRLRGRN